MRATQAVVLLAAVPTLAVAHWGDDPSPPRQRTLVTTRVEFYQLDHQTLNTLLRQSPSSTDATPIRSEIETLVATDKATLLRSSAITTSGGLRSASWSGLERIYPTEFDPPEIPQSLAGPISPQSQFLTPVTPTAFETRNVGHTIQIDLENPDNPALVEYRAFASELSTDLGQKKHGRAMATLHQPLFHKIFDGPKLIQPSGKWALIGIHKPPPPTSQHLAVATFLLSTNHITGSPSTNQAILDHWNAQQESPPEEEHHEPDPPNISVLYEWFETDAATAHLLLDQHAAPHSDATPIRDHLLAELPAKTTTLLDFLTITTKPGQRVRTGSFREQIYPIYSDPPEGPSTLTGPIDPSAKIIASRTGGMTFETRHVGPAIELTPDIDHHTPTVTVNFRAEIITLRGHTHNGLPPSDLPQPLFQTILDSTMISSHPGLPTLVSMHTSPLNPAKRILTLLTTRLLKPQ